ncbi:MAG: S8 family serine peptidase [Clostridiales bacterium]|nr:S8 family serine peptidase [Clostridiales bacterium]
MKKILSCMIALTMLFTASIVNVPLYANDSQDMDNADKIICQATLDDHFSDDCVVVVIDKNNSGINKLFEKKKFKGVDLTNIEDLTEIEGDPDTKLYLDQENFKQVLKLSLVKTGKKEVLKAIRKLEKLDFVYSASPNYYYALADAEPLPGLEEGGLEASEPISAQQAGEEIAPAEEESVETELMESAAPIPEDGVQPLASAPNDPLYSSQWGINAIKAPQAWDITTGDAASTPMSQRVMVGVIDSGVADHPDLTDNVYWDMARDFYHDTAGKAAVTDDIGGHGTNVASVIGAKGNNGVGVSGICWNVAIIPMQTLITEGSGKGMLDGNAIKKAFTYAINNNIPILNCSYGKLTTDESEASYMKNYKGLIVCSAGNESTNTDIDPAMPACLPLDNIISVAATKANSVYLADVNDWGYYNGKPQGSNYGTSTVDIAAPGTGIYAAHINGGYNKEFCGTSAAAPFVSGVAALILSKRPGLTGTHLKYLLTAYASGMGELSGKVANGAFLNAYAAVNGAMNDTVKVTFNANGGDCEESYRYYVKGRKYWDLPTTTRTRCTFNGWYQNNTKITETSTVPNSNVTLNANWKVRVFYYYDEDTLEAIEECTFGQSGTLKLSKTLAKTGHKFNGWQYNGTTYKPGETITIRQNMTLYADWEELYSIITYAPRYFSPGWTQRVNFTDAVKNGGQYQIPCSLLQSPGVGFYVFNGWRIKNGDGTVFTPGSTGNLPAFRSYLLEDVAYRRAKGDVSFDANGGKNPPASEMFYYDDLTITIPKAEPTRQGYTFLGWSESAAGEVSLAPGSRYMSPMSTTLYAKWVSDAFVIRFDTGTDASDEVQAYNPPLSVTYATSGQSAGITLPDEEMVRAGYTFKGWSFTYNGKTTIYSKGQNFKLPTALLADFSKDGGNVVKLTAVWERYPEEQLMAFVDLTKYGGRTNAVYLRNVTRGGTYGEAYNPDDAAKTAAFPTPAARTGYYFDGWADADGNVVTAQTPVGKEGFHLVYARWVKAASYNDVSSSDPLLQHISKCYAYGYMTGTSANQFSPNDTVTRGIAAVVLHRFEGSPVCGNNAFYDVDTTTAAGASNKTSEAITWLYENGIASGLGTNYFGQAEQITREQMMVLLYRYVKYRGGYSSGDINTKCLDVYTDKNQISASALEAVQWAVSQKIISGTSSTVLSPNGTVTRAQLAAFIMRTRQLLVEKGKIVEINTNGASVNHAADQVGLLNKTLADNSWEQISAASQAGVADLLWHVGDEKKVKLSTGESLTLQIYGFNHDNLTAGGKAGITFGLKEIMQNARAMAGSDTNQGGFTESSMYRWLNEDVYKSLPADLRTSIKAADKKTSVGGGSTNIRTDSMKIFLFSEVECFGTTYHSAEGEGQKYAIFTDDESRIKVLEGPQILEWWERSPRLSDTSSFCLVHATGHAGYVAAGWPYAGVNFGFCV